MFDGPILSIYPGTDRIIYMNPPDFNKETGHFDNQFCWCLPRPIMLTLPDGEEVEELGHKPIHYNFMEDCVNGQEE